MPHNYIQITHIQITHLHSFYYFILQLRQLSAMLVMDDNEADEDDPAAVYESASEEAVTRVGTCVGDWGDAASSTLLHPHSATPSSSQADEFTSQ